MEECEDPQVPDSIRQRAAAGSPGQPWTGPDSAGQHDSTREYWNPTIEEQAALNAIEDEAARTLLSNQLFLTWRQGRLDENARRKALNEVAKTRIDLEVKDLKERGDTINKIMGQILEDMTKTSRERIEKYEKNPDEVENEEETQNLEEARERGAWLFIFEAARETHMFQGITTDRVQLNIISTLKFITIFSSFTRLGNIS